MKLRVVSLAALISLSSCTSVDQVIKNKELYCGKAYKTLRGVGRGALSATTGVVLPDVCDTIDAIAEEESAE